MRILMVIFTLLSTSISIPYILEIKQVEMLVYNMYTEHFREYVLINENGEILFDKEMIKKDVEKQGYTISFKEEFLSFIISFKKIFSFEKEYIFYLEKNNEIK